MRYAFVHAQKAKYGIRALCDALEVSRSGYYAWLTRGPCNRDEQNADLREHIEEIFEETRHSYGSPRMTHALRERGCIAGRHRVARIMREMGLYAFRKRRYRRSTDDSSQLYVAGNLQR